MRVAKEIRIPGKVQRLLSACGVDHSAHGGHAVGRNAYPFGMLPDGGLVRSEIDAVDLVASYVAMEPLDRGAHFLQNANRLLGDLT